jgi:flagellar biosynthesis/type III secretory pathway chaperone
MTALETDLLAELIGQKLDCLVQLRDMGEKQLGFVRADRITELLDVLSAKQRVLARLQRIEANRAPFRGQEPQKRRWRTPDQRQRCAQLLEQCETLLGEIVAREKQSEQELIRRRDDLAAQLQGMHLASEARGAYTAQLRPEVSRIDLVSGS